MKVTVGDRVHYVGGGEADLLPPGTHCAATVTAISDAEIGAVYLHVLHPVSGTENVWDKQFSEDPKPGTWHWPEKEES
ncbi:MAG: hypothetical protein JWN14_797 [Chthonomonadales bacterium]|nr:hypothetical protein [Chthonomonadales bacterium]